MYLVWKIVGFDKHSNPGPKHLGSFECKNCATFLALVGRWAGRRVATNFPDRVCDNKVSCKKPAHLDQKWSRNGCFKFSRLFRGGGDPKRGFGPKFHPFFYNRV